MSYESHNVHVENYRHQRDTVKLSNTLNMAPYSMHVVKRGTWYLTVNIVLQTISTLTASNNKVVSVHMELAKL